ncbi:magnesium Mg(2+) and cobalt Co(2+) transport protein (corA) [Solimonas aquatica]|uniref:Magnesium Mg(2+) and cobalt Co(2+) transport protein (CorA) n=1 Tax=Solimonas aquatica TaxID=489703 RepID=A0A1H9F882_9GAMM|nr:magnesium transporter CorA family protein [Solimonas aquatica]SEQ33643.1 magnesium Mg(2+) and cobalt Co(2+) transport protein (corA) [Solimonas aquatica]
MEIFSFSRQGVVPTRLARVEQIPEEGFVWLDFTRDEAAQWPSWVRRLTGVQINSDHFDDSLNPDHPSYYDGTEDYDMLVFQGLTPEIGGGDYLIESRSAAFFLFDGLLVSVRSKENLSFEQVKRKFCEIKLRFPSTPFGLVHVILDLMVDRYMSVTDELEKRLESISDDLVDPRNPFEDWQELLAYRKQAHALELICGKNLDALDNFRRDMRSELSENQRIRLNDLREHIQRVETHADSLQRDIEVAVQLHFAATAHQTNKVIQMLTVLSAIFFPLTLITGIYGMNFDHMPELHWRYGYFFALGLLVTIGGSLLLYFRRRKLF